MSYDKQIFLVVIIAAGFCLIVFVSMRMYGIKSLLTDAIFYFSKVVMGCVVGCYLEELFLQYIVNVDE